MVQPTPITSVDEARIAFASHHFINSLIESYDKASTADKRAAQVVLASHINTMFEHYDATPLLEDVSTLDLADMLDQELATP